MAKKIKLLKFSAKWCAPCHAMKPIVKKFVEAHPEVEVVEVDIDTKDGEKKSTKYGVSAVPTFVFVDPRGVPGVSLAAVVGAVKLTELEKCLASAVKVSKAS